VTSLLTQFPDHVFTERGRADTLQDSGRLAWACGPPDQLQKITGLDVIVLENGRIAALYAFLDAPGA
jgi:hypothetical protein